MALFKLSRNKSVITQLDVNKVRDWLERITVKDLYTDPSHPRTLNNSPSQNANLAFMSPKGL